jgi:hypothetical protein
VYTVAGRYQTGLQLLRFLEAGGLAGSGKRHATLLRCLSAAPEFRAFVRLEEDMDFKEDDPRSTRVLWQRKKLVGHIMDLQDDMIASATAPVVTASTRSNGQRRKAPRGPTQKLFTRFQQVLGKKKIPIHILQVKASSFAASPSSSSSSPPSPPSFASEPFRSGPVPNRLRTRYGWRAGITSDGRAR